MKRTYITTEGKRFQVILPRTIVKNKKNGKKYVKAEKWYVSLVVAKVLDYTFSVCLTLSFLIFMALLGGIGNGSHISSWMWLIPLGLALVGFLSYKIEEWLDILEF